MIDYVWGAQVSNKPKMIVRVCHCCVFRKNRSRSKKIPVILFDTSRWSAGIPTQVAPLVQVPSRPWWTSLSPWQSCGCTRRCGINRLQSIWKKWWPPVVSSLESWYKGTPPRGLRFVTPIYPNGPRWWKRASSQGHGGLNWVSSLKCGMEWGNCCIFRQTHVL